ncbi:hypothetical protein [Acinetobacter bereziniae]|uniref:hypothetical protein n=1 Tax=Acinetobacter bereziniae TaxID=106648 RepID=UPI0021D00AB3|nr:hypothetical protein [Acinetobacter bereziniae]MCU4476920.1 hypothetical protein [Acinetobacter bereziniae]
MSKKFNNKNKLENKNNSTHALIKEMHFVKNLDIGENNKNEKIKTNKKRSMPYSVDKE